MSDMGFGNVDLGALEGMLAPVNEQFGGAASPAIPGIGATDFTQQVNDAYAPKYAYYTPDVGGTAGTGGGQEPVDPIALQMQQQLEFHLLLQQ